MAALPDNDPDETNEWLEALDGVLEHEGPERAHYILEKLIDKARRSGAYLPYSANTAYINTIPASKDLRSPGDPEIEHRIRSYVRWNAAAMVLRANKNTNVGGHIASFASAATLYDVGFNHFWHAPSEKHGGDLVFVQGHSATGVYARAYMLGRLTDEQMDNFRQEVDGKGLSSYPHPWLMPDFWQFPTVSMGLGPLMAIYQARFMKYLQDRGIANTEGRKVWCFLGDGEIDEPESMGAIGVAAREKLDNLIFVVNCNLQRLDGPVRGNGKIIQELEADFRGAGWNVIKVIWGSYWDPLLAKDRSGLLLKRMEECLDGEYQTIKSKDGAYVRKHFFGKYPQLLELVANMTDDDIWRLNRGGHDPHKLFTAYTAAVNHTGQPTVILAKTIKGYGMGEAGEGRNITHQQKKLNEDELIYIKNRFNIPIPDDAVHTLSFYKPAEDSPEMQYLKRRTEAMGGPLPIRKVKPIEITAPPLDIFSDALQGSRGREASTTAAFVGVLKNLMKTPELGKYVVPIIPDEARTFGMESMFREYGIYASQGQLYKPVDSNVLLYYKEAKDGQILEEGINEAGSMATFTAAGTSYANYGVPMIPFFIYYSMFGFQRIGDLVWAFADSRGKGFLMGGTAGRTTLLGEGLQHQDGHSHVLASTVPTIACYDPAFAYEIAVIVQEGIRRMYQNNEDLFYYLTVCNENYAQPPMPAGEGIREGILKGMYKYQAASNGPARLQLFGSGPILNEALRAQKVLAEKYNVAADVWSITSYNELRRDALAVERWNMLHPTETPRVPYLIKALEGVNGPIVASSDYMKIVPDQIAPWLPGRLVTLGTDGFGRSDNRQYLRRHFEIDAESIVAASLSRLARDGQFDGAAAAQAIRDLGINPDKQDPARA